MAITRTNRHALDTLIERGKHRSRSAFARDAGISRGALADVLSGRRDAGADALARFASALDVDIRALSTDPDGIVPPLVGVLREAERLIAAGVDGGLRRAVDECRRAGIA